MHDAARRYVLGEVTLRAIPDGPVVEIGARNINGTIRDLFPGRRYIGVDALPGPDVDVVCNGARYQPDEPAAVVICMETLEHAVDAAAICANAHQMLKPGGIFLVTAAGIGRAPHSGVDGLSLRAGEFYENVSEQHLRSWLSCFGRATIRLNPSVGDIYATAIKEPVS